jgi:transposase-like protein
MGGEMRQLVERPRRRRFTAAYKLEVLRDADACTKPGEVGALLRREGLYTSHLSAWRKQRDEGALKALSKARGRPKPNPLEADNARLRRRAERAEAELAKARKVIEVQGNVSALLEELLQVGMSLVVLRDSRFSIDRNDDFCPRSFRIEARHRQAPKGVSKPVRI